MIYTGKNKEFIQLESSKAVGGYFFEKINPSELLFLWILDENTRIKIDDVLFHPKINSIFCFTEFNQIEVSQIGACNLIKFNKSFYCVLHHDQEVSCKGILFYGANQLPLFQIPEGELEKIEILWKMFEIEMQSSDELQLEMLQTMLKRFIILCTRIYKSQNDYHTLEVNELDLVREYNFLVENHFREKHAVQDYAELLNKSPKTISNLFSKISARTPLQIIHDRKMLEAKRLLSYTQKPIKEIAFEIGFEDIQTFSRFFKKIEKVSPSDYKKRIKGTLVNS
jgi:AraC family transcriptional regulator, transcriptional activator of pobA